MSLAALITAQSIGVRKNRPEWFANKELSLPGIYYLIAKYRSQTLTQKPTSMTYDSFLAAVGKRAAKENVVFFMVAEKPLPRPAKDQYLRFFVRGPFKDKRLDNFYLDMGCEILHIIDKEGYHSPWG